MHFLSHLHCIATYDISLQELLLQLWFSWIFGDSRLVRINLSWENKRQCIFPGQARNAMRIKITISLWILFVFYFVGEAANQTATSQFVEGWSAFHFHVNSTARRGTFRKRSSKFAPQVSRLISRRCGTGFVIKIELIAKLYTFESWTFVINEFFKDKSSAFCAWFCSLITQTFVDKQELKFCCWKYLALLKATSLYSLDESLP